MTTCVAIKITDKETVNISGKDVKLNSSELCELYQTWSEENNDCVLYLTNKKFDAVKRSTLKSVLLYVDSETAYLVDVVKVGLSWPEPVVRVPSGYSLPSLLDGKESTGWLALSGKWVLVDPSQYIMDTQPDVTIKGVFTSTKSTQVYAHMA